MWIIVQLYTYKLEVYMLFSDAHDIFDIYKYSHVQYCHLKEFSNSIRRDTSK